MALEGGTLLYIQKFWDTILSTFYQSISTNKSWPPYESLTAEHQNISYFILQPSTSPKCATSKENYEAFSIALRFHLVKDNTISSSKVPISHVKLITYMNDDNGFGLLIYVVFSMSPQLGGIVTKSSRPCDILSPWEGETLPQLHLRSLQIINKIFLLQDKIGQINNLKDKYII